MNIVNWTTPKRGHTSNIVIHVYKFTLKSLVKIMVRVIIVPEVFLVQFDFLDYYLSNFPSEKPYMSRLCLTKALDIFCVMGIMKHIIRAKRNSY